MGYFATRIIAWQRQHGRNTLPWQGADAYRVWLSEIMLQQTQVATVLPYYQNFLAHFPDIATLAAADEEAVLTHWSGLGYYSRARNLHRTARDIMQHHDGKFPSTFDDILALPGIGRSTAAAICALAFHQRHAILDGNVKRVLARYCAIAGYSGDKKIEVQLWQQAEALLPQQNIAIYTQGLMDLGTLVCKRSKPLCTLCPVQTDCAAYQTGQTAQLPTPRPRKPLPQKHSTFLLLLNGSDILLQKRPPSGIWGGLWCLPQVEAGQNIDTYCMQHFGGMAQKTIALPVFTHTFTHFNLHISPLLLHWQHQPRQTQEPGSMWLDVQEALGAAIPTPVRKLLQDIHTTLQESASQSINIS
ncbi:MAG: A/G-specific adenine glycosylase [Gallionellaceae bacterium]|nr:A/G-specific adenine glycosylase [Gallionellaceae bacterium]